jgi:hypothetical protein
MERADPSGCAVWGIGLDHLDTETVGSNPSSGMDVCPPQFFIIIIHLLPYHNAT